ncbi:MAG: flavin reductase family protein [Lentisphaeria bacterium]|nr:flavin reductase family protein [Lentisphaeria bacterium]
MSVLNEVMEQLPRGAFLTVKYGNRLNTMTIGWGTAGVVWTRPIFMAAVRLSRHTFRLIEPAGNFTVSVPSDDSCRQALAFCGTKSGRDCDKFRECGLGTVPSRTVSTPIVDIAGLHFECKTVVREAMSPDLMDPALLELYPKRDYHTMYFGEILAAYRRVAE